MYPLVICCIACIAIDHHLVGGIPTYPSEKYEFVSWDDYSQLNGKITFMFQTTNQYWTSPLVSHPTRSSSVAMQQIFVEGMNRSRLQLSLGIRACTSAIVLPSANGPIRRDLHRRLFLWLGHTSQDMCQLNLDHPSVVSMWEKTPMVDHLLVLFCCELHERTVKHRESYSWNHQDWSILNQPTWGTRTNKSLMVSSHHTVNAAKWEFCPSSGKYIKPSQTSSRLWVLIFNGWKL